MDPNIRKENCMSHKRDLLFVLLWQYGDFGLKTSQEEKNKIHKIQIL